jgi:hypothetical protein
MDENEEKLKMQTLEEIFNSGLYTVDKDYSNDKKTEYFEKLKKMDLEELKSYYSKNTMIITEKSKDEIIYNIFNNCLYMKDQGYPEYFDPDKKKNVSYYSRLKEMQLSKLRRHYKRLLRK